MINEELLRVLSPITDEEKCLLEGRTEIDRTIYTDSSSLVVDSSKLLENGKLIHIRPHTRFVHFPTHTHNYVEVIYMCKGSTKHIVNGEEITLKQGELLFLNQNAKQEIMPAGADDIAVNFIILPGFFDRSLEMMGVEDNAIRNFILGCMQGKDDTISYLHFKVADVLPVQNLIENLIWSLLNETPGKRSINQITMGLLILQLMNYTDRVEVGKNHFDQELMLSVYRYIEDNYKDGELRELAASMGYDVYWLSRAVKRIVGKTYTDLVQDKRMSQSAYLLATTHISISDIGIHVGYDNSSYFYRLFKEYYGMSPKEYRSENSAL